jgi:hypothetical protein
VRAHYRTGLNRAIWVTSVRMRREDRRRWRISRSGGTLTIAYPAEPLVSYQINRQLSGWNLPPLVISAFGAHCQQPTFPRPE